MNEEIADTIVEQLGGRGLTGALVYVGTSKLILTDDALVCEVNGNPEHRTLIRIKLTPMDVYSVTIEWSEKKTGILRGKTHLPMVFADELKAQFEQLYDDHIKEHNEGFIPL
jgi:hypothetical protein